MDPATTQSDFETLLRRSGISLAPAQLAALREGFDLMLPLLAEIRAPRTNAPADRAAEPAHAFVAAPRP